MNTYKGTCGCQTNPPTEHCIHTKELEEEFLAEVIPLNAHCRGDWYITIRKGVFVKITCGIAWETHTDEVPARRESHAWLTARCFDDNSWFKRFR